MAKCCVSFTAMQNSWYRRSFTRGGLRTSTTDLGEGTVMHCWVPKTHIPSKPTLVLIHGFGANSMWQFYRLIPLFASKFNVYVPDLLFFGESYTTRPERTETFQAQCVMGLMETHMKAHSFTCMDLFGLSYGSFVAYSMAAQYKERVGRLVLGCAGVCVEEKDMEAGMLTVKSVEEAISILLPQTAEKARELVRTSFYKPPPTMPSCFLRDFIEVMCEEYREEKKELIEALHKDRKMSDLPKITQSTLIVWGEYDKIFPLELAHRLKRHIGENAQLVVVKNVGHALNAERPKELLNHLKSFLIDTLPPPPPLKQGHPNNAH